MNENAHRQNLNIQVCSLIVYTKKAPFENDQLYYFNKKTQMVLEKKIGFFYFSDLCIVFFFGKKYAKNLRINSSLL